MLITEKRLRALIRETLINEGSVAAIGLAAADAMLPKEYQGLLNPLSRDFLLSPAGALHKYKDDPAVQKETDKVVESLNTWASRAQLALNGLAGVLALPAPPLAAALFAIAQTAGASALLSRAILSAAKGEGSSAAKDLALVALDVVIGGMGEKMILKVSEKIGVAAAANVHLVPWLKSIAKSGDIAQLRAMDFAAGATSAASLVTTNKIISSVLDYAGKVMLEFAESYKGSADTSEVERMSANLMAAADQVREEGIVSPVPEEMEVEWRPGE